MGLFRARRAEARARAYAVLGVCALVFIAASLPSLAAGAMHEQNIFASDLAAAKRALERAHQRLANANAAIAAAEAELPAAQATLTRAEPIAARLRRAADRLLATANRRAAQVRARREAALTRVTSARAAHRSELARWHVRRGRFVSLAALLVALGGAGLLMVRTAASAPSDDERARRANATALLLGSSVALYLCGLIAALSAVGAWWFSWWAVGAAAVGPVAAVAGTLLAWRRARPLHGWQLATAAVSSTLLIAAAVVPSALAMKSNAPRPPVLAASTLRLAELARVGGSLPPHVQALREKALAADERATAAEHRFDAASSRVDELERQRDAGFRRQRSAMNAVEQRYRELRDVQAEYDDYQTLLVDTGGGGDEVDVPYDVGPGEGYYLPSAPDAPTTENFGSGRGSIGLCADGTLSDSIGRPGACSHHGGVG